jgi:hypothetical protein
LRERIAAIFDDSDQTCGYRRVHAQLARNGVEAGPELVRSIMVDAGLWPASPGPTRSPPSPTMTHTVPRTCANGTSPHPPPARSWWADIT